METTVEINGTGTWQDLWREHCQDQWRETETVATTTNKRVTQAYRQAPWRIQTQRGALLLIVAILGASILWVMVSVTVQAASAGLEIQNLEEEKEVLKRQIAGMQTDIANLTSKSLMEQRARDQGFEPVNPQDVTFVVVPGYAGRDSTLHAPPPRSKIEQPIIKPAYTQSLWEWMLKGVLEISDQPGGTTP